MTLVKLLTLTLLLMINNATYAMRLLLPMISNTVRHRVRHMNDVSFNPHYYAALDEESKMQAYKLEMRYRNRIKRAHCAMFEALRKSGDEKDKALRFEFNSSTPIGAALKHRMQVPYRCTRPAEIAALTSMLDNGFNVLVCKDESNGEMHEFYAWNFPYHRLISAITECNRDKESRLPIIADYVCRLNSIRFGGKVAKSLGADNALQASYIYEDFCEILENLWRILDKKG